LHIRMMTMIHYTARVVMAN